MTYGELLQAFFDHSNAYHVTLDVLTIAALWIIAYRRGKGRQAATAES